MQTVQLHRHDPYIVQLQAQCILYPKGAQMRPVRTNHMQEFCSSLIKNQIEPLTAYHHYK